MTSQRWWCEHAWLGGPDVSPRVAITAVDGIVTELEPDIERCPAGAQRLAGVTIPGLANAHSHAFHRALRGRTQRDAGSFWSWRHQMYALAERLDPDSYRTLARAVFGEMALAGVTSVGEFHYLHHAERGGRYSDPNAMTAAIVHAAADVGVRITVLDTLYLHGGLDGRGDRVALSPVQQRFSDGSVDAWCSRVDEARGRFDTSMARIGCAIHSVRAVDPAAVAVAAAFAGERELALHAHVSEQAAENEQCLAAYGATPVDVLDCSGALSERFTAVHATHPTPGDIVRLGAAGATVCLCPTTERDLADGIGPAKALAEAGAALAVGSDSHAVIDLFEEARAVELDERLASGLRGHHTAEALLTAATGGGHRSLGWPTAGRIAVGAPADLVTVSLESVRLAGSATSSLLDSIVFAAAAGDVRSVVVAGRAVVVDGHHVSIDVIAELERACAS